MHVGVHLEIPCQFSAHFLRLKPFSTASKSFGLIELLVKNLRSEFRCNYNTINEIDPCEHENGIRI